MASGHRNNWQQKSNSGELEGKNTQQLALGAGWRARRGAGRGTERAHRQAGGWTLGGGPRERLGAGAGSGREARVGAEWARWDAGLRAVCEPGERALSGGSRRASGRLWSGFRPGRRADWGPPGTRWPAGGRKAAPRRASAPPRCPRLAAQGPGALSPSLPRPRAGCAGLGPTRLPPAPPEPTAASPCGRVITAKGSRETEARSAAIRARQRESETQKGRGRSGRGAEGSRRPWLGRDEGGFAKPPGPGTASPWCAGVEPVAAQKGLQRGPLPLRRAPPAPRRAAWAPSPVRSRQGADGRQL